MTLNRMGRTRRPSNRKAWLTGTVAVGALVATGGVATAALAHSSDDSSTKVAPASHQEDSDRSERGDDHEGREHKKGPVCLRLDKKALKSATAATAQADGSVVVPVDKVQVVPCPRSSTPVQAPAKPAPIRSATPAPSKTTAPAPEPSASKPPAPAPVKTPVPPVATTAS